MSGPATRLTRVKRTDTKEPEAAMPFFFINAGLLAAVITAGAPLVIHLLHRRRAREDALPTLRFLRAGAAANRQRLRMRHLLVLALRVSAVVLIIAALARPAYRGALFFRGGTAAVNAVVVLDNSLSMAHEDAGRTYFDKAKQLSKEILRGLAPGSRVGLVVTGLGPRGEISDRELTFDKAGIEDVIEKVEVSAYGGECARGLASAYAMLSQVDSDGGAAANEVYAVTDLMRNSLGGLEAVKPPENTATIILDVGKDTSDNFHISSVEGRWLTSPTGHIELEASIESAALEAKRLVEAHFEGAKRAEKLVAMPANARVDIELAVPAAAGAGPRQGWVALADSDPISADNTRYFTVEAGNPLRCLVLGHRCEGAGGNTGFFVRNALEPATLAGGTYSRAKYSDWQEFRKSDLDDADVVILADAGDVPRQTMESLAEFAAAGNGLVVFAGESAGGKGHEWLAGEYFGGAIGQAESAPADKAMRLSAIALDHPMLAAFREGRNGNLAEARFYRWRKFVPGGEVMTAVELARFAGGEPAIMAAQAGSGRIVMAAFSPVREATDLVLRAPFVPLVNEMAGYAAGGKSPAKRGRARNFTVGDTVSFSVERSGRETLAEISAPWSGNPVEVSIPPGATAFAFRPFSPGNYLVRVRGGAAQAGFSANISAAESKFERVAPEEIASALRGAVVAKDLSERPVRRVYGSTRGAREIFDLALVAAIILLAVEEYLANRVYSASAGE